MPRAKLGRGHHTPNPQRRQHKKRRHPYALRHLRHREAPKNHRGGYQRQGDPDTQTPVGSGAGEKDAASQRQPDPGVHDVHDVAIKPATVEGHQKPDPVGVEPVQQRVAGHAQVGQKENPSGPDGWMCGRPATQPSTPGQNQPRQEDGQYRHGQHPMGPAPAVVKSQIRIDPKEDRVDVGQVGGNNQGWKGQCRPARPGCLG